MRSLSHLEEELDALMPAQHERNLFSKCCLCSPTPYVAWAAVDDGKVEHQDTHLCVQQQDYYLKADSCAVICRDVGQDVNENLHAMTQKADHGKRSEPRDVANFVTDDLKRALGKNGEVTDFLTNYFELGDDEVGGTYERKWAGTCVNWRARMGLLATRLERYHLRGWIGSPGGWFGGKFGSPGGADNRMRAARAIEKAPVCFTPDFAGLGIVDHPKWLTEKE